VTELVKRKLIEVALPLEAINIASGREGYIYRGNPSAVHKWWAQRPLAACRAVLFASVVDDPASDPDRFPTPKAQEDERRRLFSIIEKLVLWESTTDERVLEEARSEIRRATGGNPPRILDPFCGGGSIPLEAQRLGLQAEASDLNPLAVLLTKTLVQVPVSFQNQVPVHPTTRGQIEATGTWNGSSGLAEDVRRYGRWLRDETAKRIGEQYPDVKLSGDQGGRRAAPIAWLWARTVECPNPACRARVPLARSFALSTKRGREVSAHPVVDAAARSLRFEVRPGKPTGAGSMSRRGATCLVCSTSVSLDHIRREGRGGRMYAQLLATVVEGASGRTYVSPDARQEAAADVESPPWLPDQPLSTHPQYMGTPRYGLGTFADLFTKRQKVLLSTLVALVQEARQTVLADALQADMAPKIAAAYADAIATFLAFAVDKSAEYNSSVVAWNSLENRPKNVFTRQAIPMIWDFVELNPLGDMGGTIEGAVRVVADAIPAAPSAAPVTVAQVDARKIAVAPGSVVVCTDPPYYDNVPYADLSDFFYVWLRKSLEGVYPDLLSTLLTPKADELVADSERFGGRARAHHEFETGLTSVFERLAAAQDGSYPMTVFYAFRQTETDSASGDDAALTSTGWESILEALAAAGLGIHGTWPMRTERVVRSRSVGSNALASSIVLVCRPRSSDAGITTRKDFVASLKREMPEALRTLQHGNIAPVDLAQSSIGPGMAIYSRYSSVLEPDGSPMRVRTALALINQVLDELLSEQEGEFDADTRWAIAWYEQFGLTESAYGTAETLSKAKNSSVAGLVEAGIVAASRGRVRLLERAEYSGNWDPTKDSRIPVWEATQRLVHLLLTDGEAAAGDLLARLGGLGDTARDLAYRMYHVAERKGWTDEARAYNALVVAWTDLARGAESARDAQPAQTSLGLE